MFLLILLLSVLSWQGDSAHTPREMTVTGRRGDQVTLLCPFTPEYWIGNNEIIADDKGVKMGLRQNYRVQTYRNGSASLTINQLTVDGNITFTCSLAQQRVNIHVIALKAPSEPQLQTHKVVAGDTAVAKCSSVDGNPPSVLHWYVDGRLVLDGVRTIIDKGVRISEYEYSPSRSDAGRQLKCSVLNRALEEPLTAQQPMIVHYKPLVTIEPRVLSFQQNAAVQIKCVTDAKPEPSDIQWILNRVVVSHSRTYRIQSADDTHAGNLTCRARNLVGINESTKPVTIYIRPSMRAENLADHYNVGDRIDVTCRVTARPPASNINWKRHNRTVSGNQHLVINRATASDHGTYSCAARHSITDQNGHKRLETFTEQFAVNVYHAPVVRQVTLDRLAVIGSTAVLTCATVLPGHPPSHFRWWLAGDEINNGGAQTLRLRDVTRNEEGNYSCRAENSVGVSAREYIVLRVYKAPGRGRHHSVVRDGQLTVACEALAYPLPRVTWYRQHVLVSALSQFHKQTTEYRLHASNDLEYNVSSRLRMVLDNGTDVARAVGEYACVFENMAGQLILHVNASVRHKPVITDDTAEVAHGLLAHSTRLVCEVTANPPATVTWRRNHKQLAPSGRYSFSSAPHADGTRRSHVLHVQGLAPADFGAYTCEARNYLGSSQKTIALRQHEPVCRVTGVDVLQVESHQALLLVRPPLRGEGEGEYVVTARDRELVAMQQRCEQAPCRIKELVPLTEYTIEVGCVKGDEISQHKSLRLVTSGNPEEIPQPRQLHYDQQSGVMLVKMVGILQADVIIRIDTEVSPNYWIADAHVLQITQNTTLYKLSSHRHEHRGVKAVLCYKLNTSLCGPPLQVVRAAPGSLLMPGESSSFGLIIGIVIVGCLLSVLLFLLVCCCMRKRVYNEKKTPKKWFELPHRQDTSSVFGYRSNDTISKTPLQPSDVDYHQQPRVNDGFHDDGYMSNYGSLPVNCRGDSTNPDPYGNQGLVWPGSTSSDLSQQLARPAQSDYMHERGVPPDIGIPYSGQPAMYAEHVTPPPPEMEDEMAQTPKRSASRRVIREIVV